MFKRKKNEKNYPMSLIVNNTPKSTISEQFRTIRTNLQFSMVDKTLKTLTITSAGPNSGKTTISANLAATFAQENQRVLLIDSDLRKPTLHKLFNVKNFKGLSTLIADQSNLSEVIQETDVDNLFLLTSGPVPPNPTELLSSERMNQLIKDAEQYFDLVIYDTPPVLAVTDAQILASRTDGVLMVVPKGEVKKEQLEKTNELLENVRANVLGFVMNKVEKSDDNYYYYYAD